MHKTSPIIVGLLVGVFVFTGCARDSADKGTSTETKAAAKPAIVAVAPSKGCGSAATVAAGHEKITMTSGDTETPSVSTRWFWRDIPAAHDGETPVPVVVDFHGYSEGADVHLMMSDLTTYGGEKGFVTITPQGQGPVPRWDVAGDSVDMTYVDNFLDQIGETLCIDENRIFATGLSNGAMMSSAIACSRADRFAAVSPVAGIRAPDECEPARAVPVVAFHGTKDEFLGYDGCFGSRVSTLPAPDGSTRPAPDLSTTTTPAPCGPTVPEMTAKWAKRNGCTAAPKETKIAADVTKIAYACSNGADVELYTVAEGGHTWPGSKFSQQIESIVGPTSMSISANKIMWDFFENHPRSS